MNAHKPVTWKGSQTFRLTASGLHEDTLRVVPNYRRQEMLLQLRLPTLCITYADVRFQNAVGGEQENYPASRAYGPAHFDPPVEITGEADIERLTYIRGAQPLPETVVDIWRWDPKLPTPYGQGGFRLDASLWTDGSGGVEAPGRPSGQLEAYSVRRPGWRVVPRCLRPLAGQKVRLHMRGSQ